MPVAGRFTAVAPEGATVTPAAPPPVAAAAPAPDAQGAPPVPAEGAAPITPPAPSSAPAAAAPAPSGADSPPADAPPADPKAAEPPKPGDPPKETKPEPSADAWRFAALSKKERAIREEAEKVKAEKAAIEKERAELAAARAEKEKRAQTYRLNPLAALEDAGLSYEEVTQYILNNGQATPDQKIKALAEQVQQTNARLEAERKERAEAIAAQQKAAEEREAQTAAARAEQAKASYLEELGSVAAADPETYEMVRLAGADATERLWKAAEALYAETGRAPSNKAVLDKVEAEYFAEAEAALKASKKLARMFAPPPPPPPAPEPVPVPPKTLSNRMTPAPAPRAEGRRESRAERDARVLAEVTARLRGQG